MPSITESYEESNQLLSNYILVVLVCKPDTEFSYSQQRAITLTLPGKPAFSVYNSFLLGIASQAERGSAFLCKCVLWKISLLKKKVVRVTLHCCTIHSPTSKDVDICFVVVNWQEGQRSNVRDEKTRGANKERM